MFSKKIITKALVILSISAAIGIFMWVRSLDFEFEYNCSAKPTPPWNPCGKKWTPPPVDNTL